MLLDKIPEKYRAYEWQYVFIMVYTVLLIIAMVVIHEGAHALSAMAFGARFSELQFGFLGINPSITLTEWPTGTPQKVVYYAGGFAAGTALLLFYLFYWMRKYRQNATIFVWIMGMVTLMMAGTQFASGYLEGRFHTAYIIGSMSMFSPSNILIYAWAFATVFFHLSLCPWNRMKKAKESATVLLE